MTYLNEPSAAGASRILVAFLGDALIEELKKMNPLERLGQPEDMANVVSFLAGPEGGWINSQVVRPNGGFAY